MSGMAGTGIIKRRTFLGSSLAALVAGRAQAEEDCRMHRVAAFQINPINNMVVIQNAIGDKPVRMLVDTGAVETCFTEAKAAELGLHIEDNADPRLMMYGGMPLRRTVSTAEFRIGNITTPRYTYALIPSGRLVDGVEGILGLDFLGNFDLDFDFAGAKFNLFSNAHCPGRVGYWTTEKLEPIPIIRDRDAVDMVIHVQLDGEDFKAIVDSGSTNSVMSLELARRVFGIADDDPRLKSDERFSGMNGVKRFPFKKMTFGHVDVNAPDIALVPSTESQMDPLMILGLSVLRHLHVYIAYRDREIYVTAATA